MLAIGGPKGGGGKGMDALKITSATSLHRNSIGPQWKSLDSSQTGNFYYYSFFMK